MNRSEHIGRLAGRQQNRRGRPVLSYIVGEGWILVSPWTVQAGLCDLTVPAGFHFDLSSTPRLIWPLISPFDCSIEAPLAHDFVYRYHDAGGRVWKRREADRLFLQLMRRESVRAWRRSLAWLAVRLAGFWAWRTSPGLA